MIKIYDSLKEKNIPFKPIKKDEVSFYVCGPTVYGPGHVGHARTYIAFDIIRRVEKMLNISEIDLSAENFYSHTKQFKGPF